MDFKNIIQIYRYQLIEMLMNCNDEDFLDLMWKLGCQEQSVEVGA